MKKNQHSTFTTRTPSGAEKPSPELSGNNGLTCCRLVDFTRLPSPTPENKDLFFVTKGSSLQPASGDPFNFDPSSTPEASCATSELLRVSP